MLMEAESFRAAPKSGYQVYIDYVPVVHALCLDIFLFL